MCFDNINPFWNETKLDFIFQLNSLLAAHEMAHTSTILAFIKLFLRMKYMSILMKVRTKYYVECGMICYIYRFLQCHYLPEPLMGQMNEMSLN